VHLLAFTIEVILWCTALWTSKQIAYDSFVQGPWGKCPFWVQGIDGSVVLKWIINNSCGSISRTEVLFSVFWDMKLCLLWEWFLTSVRNSVDSVKVMTSQPLTQLHIPGGLNPHKHLCENFTSFRTEVRWAMDHLWAYENCDEMFGCKM